MNLTYKRMNEKICPSQELINNTISLTKKRKNSVMRPIAILAACLCLAFAVPVAAANVPVAYNIMYAISPAVAQHFVPVNKSCEDKGIKMEVESAYIHDNTAEIYITMQDMTGELLDETTDLFDSYSINRAFDSSATCRIVDYDEDTHTSRFLIYISEYGDHDISGEKITFSVSEMISKKTSLEDVEIPIDMSKVREAENIQKHNAVGLSGRDILDNDSIDDLYIAPGEDIYKITDNMSISGIGYINGKLHVQLKMIGKLELDPHGHVYLVSKTGETVKSVYAKSFLQKNDERVDYEDHVFDIPIEKIGEYELFGSFYTAGVNIEGDWQVTFDVSDIDKQVA